MDLSPEMQQAVVALLGAVTLAVPLTARAIPRAVERLSSARADATKSEAAAVLKRAEAARLEAEAAKGALDDFRKRLDDCERKHVEQERKRAQQAQLIEHLQKQSASDTLLLEKFAEKMERDEALLRGMKAELDELRKILKTGGRNA